MNPLNFITQNTIPCTFSASARATADYQLHCHPHYEIFYLIEGDVSFLSEGISYTPTPHSLMIFPPGVFHGVRVMTERPYKRYILYFYDTCLPVETRNYLLAAFTPQLGTLRQSLYFSDVSELNLQPFLDSLVKSQTLPDPIRDTMCTAYLQALLGQLPDLHSLKRETPGSSQELRVLEVLHYLNEHLDEPISLDQLAATFYLSKNYMNSLFRKMTGTTIIHYLNHKRIVRAQQLLFDGVPAADAASAVGFTDYSSFFRAYEKILGHNPSQDKENPYSSTLPPLT